MQRAKKAGGKKERRNRRVTARVKTLEEGQYKLFNILREIQEFIYLMVGGAGYRGGDWPERQRGLGGGG